MQTSANAQNKLKELANSALVRSIAIAFFVLILLESAFLSLLVANTMEVEKTASDEYKILKALEQCSHLAAVLRRLRCDADDWYNYGHDPRYYQMHEQSKQVMAKAIPEARRIWKEASLPPDMIESLISGCEQTVKDTTAALNSTNFADCEKYYGMCVGDTRKIYPIAVQQIGIVQEHLRKQQAAQPQQRDPLSIIFTGVLINVFLAVIMAILAYRFIASPIRELARNCEKLKRGEPLPAPPRIRNEINSLELAFHKMSLSIARNEQGRKGYMQLLKNMQSASLSKVKDTLSKPILSSMLNDSSQKRISHLRTSVDDMMRLLDSMADGLSFNEHAAVQIKAEETDAATIIQRSISALESLVKRKGISLESNEQHCKLIADEHLLGRVLVNFLSNAIKFSPKDSYIKLNGTALDGSFRFEVQDAGPGISEADQEKLFQKFSQLESTEKRSGSGLGLMICKQIVEAHGGEIGCTSKPGEGSTFWFTVPLVAAQSKLSAITIDKKKLKTSRGSIQTVFVSMLIVFLLCQFLVAISLGNKFNAAAQTAQRYARERKLIIHSQEMFVSLFGFSAKIRRAMEQTDTRDMDSVVPLMDDLIRTIQSVKDEAKPHPEISSSLKRLEKGVKALRKTAKSALADFPQSGFLNLLSKFKGSGKITANMEDTLFEILHSENAVLDSSYELGTQVRNEVLFLIVLCAVANLFLLSFLAYTGIKILSKIQILAGKADAFAAGNNLSPSIKGKDELNYLDESLCEVANSIRQAEARRTELLAVINHDLRTPLGSILAGLELIQSGIASDSPANLNELFDQVEAELQTLLEQINNLLLLEKLDTGSLKLDTASVDLSELLEEAVAEANRKWCDKKKSVSLKLPESEHDFLVNGELALLNTMLTALMRNACEAAPPDSQVRVELLDGNAEARIRVIDEGPGVPAQLQQQLFERFRFVSGEPISGLGLPLAYRLATIHGGSLTLESSSKEGTVFCVSFANPASTSFASGQSGMNAH